MLEIVIPAQQTFNETTSKFVNFESVTLRLEHSLLSMSKWESIWEVPFFSREKKTAQQVLSYVKLMADAPVSDDTLSLLRASDLNRLNEYLDAKHSATWFSDEGEKANSTQTVTSELIYYWMTAFSIWIECESWPLPRLMNLIKIAQLKSDTGKKKGRSKTQMLSERASLNAKRRAEQKSKG